MTVGQAKMKNALRLFSLEKKGFGGDPEQDFLLETSSPSRGLLNYRNMSQSPPPHNFGYAFGWFGFKCCVLFHVS